MNSIWGNIFCLKCVNMKTWVCKITGIVVRTNRTAAQDMRPVQYKITVQVLHMVKKNAVLQNDFLSFSLNHIKLTQILPSSVSMALN